MAISTVAILLLNSLFSASAKSEEMRTRDPYIVCPGTYVPDHAHGLPRGYNIDDYFNVMQLCSALNGNAKNVGCACSSSNEGSLYCFPAVADPNLYHAVIRPSLKPFPTFCAESCMCTDIQTARDARNNPTTSRGQRGGRTTFGSGGFWDPNDSNYHITSTGEGSGGGSASGSTQVPYDPDIGWDEMDSEASPVPSAPVVSHDQCWNNCTSNADCLKGGEQGCMCSTRSEQYQPGSGTVAFVAACIISMSGNGGKREVAGPCPCNATYVSHACCGIADGLVWGG